MEERYKQLKARTTVQPSNNVPAPQGSILRTKIVVNPFFRDVIHLKGSKAIYANIIIDTSQNKYVRLEPLWYGIFLGDSYPRLLMHTNPFSLNSFLKAKIPVDWSIGLSELSWEDQQQIQE